jgi:hypothetical protein
LCLCPAAPVVAEATLSLHRAEQAALSHDPVTKKRLAAAEVEIRISVAWHYSQTRYQCGIKPGGNHGR